MATDPRRRSKTFADRLRRPEPSRGPADPAHRTPAQRSPERAPAVHGAVPAAVRRPDAGKPLEPDVRRRLEEGFGRRLDHVRVHSAPEDRQLARSQRARALAHRHHIWLGPRESPRDVALLAHEVTHVAQQGHAPAAPAGTLSTPAAAGTIASRRPGPVHGAGAGPGRGAPAVAAPARAAGGGGAVQKLGWDIDVWGAARAAGGAVVSGVTSAAGAVADVAGDLASMAWDGLMGIVRRVAPDFLRLFEGGGIVGFVRDLAERGLRSLFDGLTGPLRGILDFNAIGTGVSQAVSWIGAIAGQLARNDCSGILAAARQVGAFFSGALQPVFDRIRSVSDAVSGFFRGVWEAIGVPILDILKNIGGSIWSSFRGFVSDVAAVIRTVREALGGAWQRVKSFFGIGAESGDSEGGGLWEWIKEKAAAVGESVSNAVKPVIGPLRSVGGVLLLIVPGGQVIGLMLLWPRLKQAWAQLTGIWNDLNLIPRARHFLANTVLPAVMSAAEGVGQALVAAADWLLGLISRVASGLSSAMQAATGLLTPLARVIGYAHQQFQRVVSWAREGLRAASSNMRSLLQRLVAFLGLVLDVMRRLIAIAVNPFGIVGFLAGTLWRLVPDCLKGPIIDFILDIIIRVLRAMPPMPQLGLLWPVIKSAALGFLERVRSFAVERKVNVSKKIARIVSGESTSFAFGLLKGLALGVWEGIIAPFQAIATIFELPTMVQTFLSNLGLRLCDLIESIRCFAADLAGRVFGSLDQVLAGLGELLEDPGRIVDLIRCAIEGVLSGAASLGATLADQMMSVFEGAEEAIGEALGRIAGNALVQAVISYFTAGAGAAVGVIQQISRVLGAVGRAIGAAVRMVTQLFGRLVGFVRSLASRFASAAASGARSVLGRLGGFFRRVAAWFGKLLGRMGRFLRRKFGLSPQQRVQWAAFRSAVRGLAASHPSGTTKRDLRGAYRGILNRYRTVAKRPAFITKHGPHWRLWVRKVKRPLPTKVGEVLLDARTRVHAAMKEVKRTVRRAKRAPGILTLGQIARVLPPVQRRFRLRELTSSYDRTRGKFEVHAVANPVGDWRTTRERPPRNVVAGMQAHRGVTIDPLSVLHGYSGPHDPPGWTEVSKIKAAPKGTHSLYVRGHLGHGRFISGASTNIAALTRQANALMRTRAEGTVISKLRLPKNRRPVFKYQVTSTPPSPSVLRTRKVDGACRAVPEEARLVSSVTVSWTEYEFNGTDWSQVEDQGSGEIENVPSFPIGKWEPCDPSSNGGSSGGGT